MNIFLFIIKFVHFFTSAAIGAATLGCSGTVSTSEQVGLLGFHDAECSQGKLFVYDLARLNFKYRQEFPKLVCERGL